MPDMSEPRPKQNRRPEQTKVANFGYLISFFILPRPLIFFEILQQNGCLRITKDPPFTFCERFAK